MNAIESNIQQRLNGCDYDSDSMLVTNDEWIMTRIGIKERRILNEEGLGTSYMARKAVKQLLEKTGTDPQQVDCLIIATTTPDYHFPSTSSIVIGRLGLKNAFAIDMQAACCGFLFAMDTAASMVQSGRYKKVVDSLYVKENTDIYITGSNAYLLSGDLATLLTGRYVDISMLPLSFREFWEISGLDAEKAFAEFMRYGGFPYISRMERTDEKVDTYLEGIYNTVVVRDIEDRQMRKQTDPDKRKITDITLLKTIARYHRLCRPFAQHAARPRRTA